MFRKAKETFWDLLGEILAIVLIVVYAIWILNANFRFIPAGAIMNILEILRKYGSIALVGVVGMEALSKRSFAVRIIFYALMALVVLFLFFPGTYANLIEIVQ